MAQVDRIYKLAFRSNFTNHEANFPPSKEIALGDYGVMKNGYFARIGNVRDASVGLSFEINIDANPTHETFKSKSDINVAFTAKGDIGSGGVVATKATMEIGFGSEEAVFFSAADVFYNEIKDIAALGQQILDLYKQGKWKKDYFIVTRLFEGKNVLIVISGTSNCKVKIEAKADAPKIDLANGESALGITNSQQTAYEIATPGLCKIGMGFSRVYDSIFLKPGFRTATDNAELFASLDNNANSNNVVFGDITPSSYDSGIA